MDWLGYVLTFLGGGGAAGLIAAAVSAFVKHSRELRADKDADQKRDHMAQDQLDLRISRYMSMIEKAMRSLTEQNEELNQKLEDERTARSLAEQKSAMLSLEKENLQAQLRAKP